MDSAHTLTLLQVALSELSLWVNLIPRLVQPTLKPIHSLGEDQFSSIVALAYFNGYCFSVVPLSICPFQYIYGIAVIVLLSLCLIYLVTESHYVHAHSHSHTHIIGTGIRPALAGRQCHKRKPSEETKPVKS